MNFSIALPSSTLASSDSAPSSPELLAPSWQASGVYIPVHKRRQDNPSTASSPAMSTMELEPDTHRSTYTREALLHIAKSPFVPLAPSSDLLHAFPSIIRAHGHGIDQALAMTSGVRSSKSFYKHQHPESKGHHGRSKSYGRSNNNNNKKGGFSHSSSDHSDHDSSGHDFSSGSDSESNWRAR